MGREIQDPVSGKPMPDIGLQKRCFLPRTSCREGRTSIYVGRPPRPRVGIVEAPPRGDLRWSRWD